LHCILSILLGILWAKGIFSGLSLLMGTPSAYQALIVDRVFPMSPILGKAMACSLLNTFLILHNLRLFILPNWKNLFRLLSYTDSSLLEDSENSIW
jgi:hypothetical protein